MYFRHHQLDAGVLVLQCDSPLLTYDHSNFRHTEDYRAYFKCFPTQTIIICEPIVAQQLAKVFY